MKLLFLGDLFFDYESIPDDYQNICNYICERDYKVILNLEGSLGIEGFPIKKRGANLRHSSKISSALKNLNVEVVCLANNHMMDYGGEALTNGIQIIEREGIKHVGAGNNYQEATRSLSIRVGSKEIVILNYGWDVEETVYAGNNKPGCNPLVREKVVDDIKEIRISNPHAFIINIFHWGFEYNTLPMPLDINFAHQCIDVGSDLIIGHHPHVIQPFESYKGKRIYYSLGNFYFSSRRKMNWRSYINESCTDYGSYGLGVAFNTEDYSTEEIGFYYDVDKDESSVISTMPESILHDLALTKWDEPDYEETAKMHAYKNNPILGLNKKKNARELKKLFCKYKIAKMIGFIKKVPGGEKIYDYLKERA